VKQVGKIEKVEDEFVSDALLQITQCEMRGMVHICVSRGTQELVIVPSKGNWSAVRINGVNESIEQGREFLCELIGKSPPEEFPRFGVRNKGTQKVSYEIENETARQWSADRVELTMELMDVDLNIRKLQFDELASMSVIADEFEEEDV
jgi:hypothetical protein